MKKQLLIMLKSGVYCSLSSIKSIYFSNYLTVLQPMLIAVLLLLSTATCLHAGPVDPMRKPVKQPDGTEIVLIPHGDEFQSWNTLEETGHTIVRNETDEYWEYAESNTDGTLRASGIRVQKGGANVPGHIPVDLRPPRNTQQQQMMNNGIKEIHNKRFSSSSSQRTPGDAGSAAPGDTQAVSFGAPGDWEPAVVLGTKKALVVMVKFSDYNSLPFHTTATDWYNSVFNESFKSVAKFYKDNSFGLLTISPVAHTQAGNPPGVITVTLPGTANPNYGGSYSIATDQAIGNSALQQITSNAYVNFDSYDTNSDGLLDPSEMAIYFIYTGYEASANNGLTPRVWAHAWWTEGTGLTAGTKNVRRWALNGELYNTTTQQPMGVVAHEIGHQVCGLPDLYDISGNNSALGHFSLMASGSWGGETGETGGTTPSALDAWSREYLGWTTPVTNPAGTVSVQPALNSSSSALKLVTTAVTSGEYFLVENRQPVSWDRGLARGLGVGWSGGLLVTHIDTTSGAVGSNDINSYAANNVAGGGHQGVVPVQASTTGCNMLVGAACPGAQTTLFYSGNNINWTPSTTPNSNYYSGAATNYSMVGVSAPASVMTASIAYSPPVLQTLNVTKTGTGSGTVTSSPAGISCGETCSALFTFPVAISLTAQPSVGSAFSGWSGACTGKANPCVLTSLDITDTVEALFTSAVPVVSETFSATTLPAGWSAVDAISSGKNWRFDNSPCNLTNGTGGSGSYALAEFYCSASPMNADTSLYTPSYNLSAYNAVSLSFKTSLIYWNTSTADVDISINGGATWNTVWRKTGGTNNTVYGPSTETLDITSATSGKPDVRIRFRYHTDSYGARWQVDDFALSGVVAPPPTPPVVTFTSVPLAVSSQSSGIIAFTANETVTFECKLDSGNFAPCTSPFSYDNLDNGQHSMTVRATDNEGTAASNTHMWTINTGLIIVTGACGASNSANIYSIPVNGLCTAGGASAVSATATGWSWNCNGSGGGSSASCSANQMAYPTSTIYQPTSSSSASLSFGWLASLTAGVTYKIEESSNGGLNYTQIASQTGNIVETTGKANGTYLYRVKATKANYVDSPWKISQPIAVALISPAIVQIYQPTTSSNGTIEIGWSPSSLSPVTYVIEESTNGGTSWNAFRSQSSNIMTVTAKANGSYMYRVKVQKSGYVESGWKTSQAITVTLTSPTISQIYQPASSSNGSIEMGWSPSSLSPVTYVIEESTNGGTIWNAFRSQSSNIMTVTAKANGSYMYRVKVQKSGYVESGWKTSQAITVTLTSPSISQIYQPASSSNGSIEMGWSPSSLSPVTYVIEESTNGGTSWNTFRSQSSNLMTVTGKTNGSYMYRIKVQKGGYADSTWSTSKAMSVLLTTGAPTTMYIPTTAKPTFDIAWSHSPQAPVTYIVEESFNGGGYVQVASQSSNILTLTGKATGQYRYRVKAQKGGGWLESGYRTSGVITVVP